MLKSYLKKLCCLFLVISLLLAGCGSSGEFPSRSIELTVPFSAGGPVDVSVRLVCSEVENILGQAIEVVNKAGGGATEGQSYVAKADPTGYYMLAMTSSIISNILTKDVDFTIDSFTPIAMYSYDAEVLIVPYDSPYQDAADLVEAAQAAPLSVSTPGHSTSHHMAGVALEQLTGATFNYVHTDGASESVPMVAGGHVDCGMTNWSEARSLVEANRLRVIGIMSDERDERCPDVPTFKEVGLDITYGAWRGLAVPAGTPDDVVQILSDAFAQALETQSVIDAFAEQDIPIRYMNAEDFKAHLDAEFVSQQELAAIIASRG